MARSAWGEAVPALLTPEDRIELLSSIEAARLFIICGAGLSQAAPSNLPSAAALARVCYDKYHPIAALHADLREDLDKLAGHFFNSGAFETAFIDGLVPWSELNGPPNLGHAAIGDFLVCGAVAAAISGNFDTMIERWVRQMRINFNAALDSATAEQAALAHSPLLKFHGCMDIARRQTVWATDQLKSDTAVQARIKSCSDWMKIKLAGKDLLFAGYWSDWDYLNSLMSDALADVTPARVWVINPIDTDELQSKAPKLWALVQAGTTKFTHIKGSADTALDELRQHFSQVWIQRFLELGKTALETELGQACDPTLTACFVGNSQSYYEFRKDAEGVASTRPARSRAPANTAQQASFAHLLLRRAGATHTGNWYDLQGKTIRIVNGGGRMLGTIETEFAEPASLPHADIVVAAGAEDFGLPADVVRTGEPGSIIRPASGSSWMDLRRARAELHI